MTHDEFESLVRRLERDAAAEPSAYRRRLTLLALLGYAYILAVLALLAGGIGAIAWLATISAAALLLVKKFGWALLVLALIVVRAMWVRIPAPRGRRLTRGDAPELFRVIDDLRERARAPRVHEVLLTDEFNAAVVQHPRFGFFGGSRNYLMLGLPLMQALAPDELRAVIAHELGHLSAAHGRFGAWIYRQRQGWARLLGALHEQGHWGSVLFTRFFDWYAPLFSAYSFVQARQQEFEADRIAAETAGAQAAAAALVRVNLLGSFLGEKFWPAVFKRATTDPEPKLAPFSMLRRALQQPGPPDAAQQWLGRSLARRTGYDDTHPCLGDRLRALGIGPFIPPAVATNAAEAFLGSTAQPLTRELDERWRREVRSWWSERHKQACEWRARLAELERTAPEALALDALWERACLTEEFDSADAALELLTLLLERDPFHAGAHFRRGRLLLERDDPRGIEDLQAASKLDTAAEGPACALIAAFHRRHGRDGLAEPLERRCRELEERAALARREREIVRAGDDFVEHDLALATVSGVAHRLRKLGGIRRALLVRKRLDDDGEPLYVLGILSHRPWWRITGASREQALIERVSQNCGVPGETLVVSLRLNPELVEPLAAVPCSQIYPRG